jgi:hypothetical protein
MEDEAGSWELELPLTETDSTTELRLVHHLTSPDQLAETGPGWEYYLDMLTAARNRGPQPDCQDYCPAQKAYFESLARPRHGSRHHVSGGRAGERGGGTRERIDLGTTSGVAVGR